jgi:hypothetical protein
MEAISLAERRYPGAECRAVSRPVQVKGSAE